MPSSWSCTKNCAPVRPMLTAAREGATADSPCAHASLILIGTCYWVCRLSNGAGRSEPSSEPARAAGHAGRAQGHSDPWIQIQCQNVGRWQWIAGARVCSQLNCQAIHGGTGAQVVYGSMSQPGAQIQVSTSLQPADQGRALPQPVLWLPCGGKQTCTAAWSACRLAWSHLAQPRAPGTSGRRAQTRVALTHCSSWQGPVL